MMRKKILFLIQKLIFSYFWNSTPRTIQFIFSKLFSSFLKTSHSIRFINPFCDRYRITPKDLEKYEPASGLSKYQSFQDFFSRRLQIIPSVEHKVIWPCEGFVCDHLKFENNNSESSTLVKGQKIKLKEIFKIEPNVKMNDYHFLNIFLHNHNYHRFHMPTSCRIEEIKHIPGKLQILRPWFYKKTQVSEPSFLNERIILKLRDIENKIWYMAFVAGMGVGHIRLHDRCKIGEFFSVGEEVGMFLLGSTCCLAIPNEVMPIQFMSTIKVFDKLPIETQIKKTHSKKHSNYHNSYLSAEL